MLFLFDIDKNDKLINIVPQAMIQTLDEFIEEFKKIKEKGWIKTHRSGPTGIGKTLEDLLDIPENNKNEPDFGDYELKSVRINSCGTLSLFDKNTLPRGSMSKICDETGYYGELCDYKKILHISLISQDWTTMEKSKYKLKMTYTDDYLFLISDLGIEVGYYTKNELEKSFNKKYKNKLVYVKAESRGTGENEEFLYTEAYLLTGFDFSKIYHLLKDGIIMIDLRCGLKMGKDGKYKRHDHANSFRIKESHQEELFLEKSRIDIVNE